VSTSSVSGSILIFSAQSRWRRFTPNQDRYADAEPLCKRALAIREKMLGPDHPTVAGSLNDLANKRMSKLL